MGQLSYIIYVTGFNSHYSPFVYICIKIAMPCFLNVADQYIVLARARFIYKFHMVTILSL